MAAMSEQEGLPADVAITTIPGALLRPLFGWREVEMFSADDSERERPVADIYASG